MTIVHDFMYVLFMKKKRESKTGQYKNGNGIILLVILENNGMMTQTNAVSTIHPFYHLIISVGFVSF